MRTLSLTHNSEGIEIEDVAFTVDGGGDEVVNDSSSATVHDRGQIMMPRADAEPAAVAPSSACAAALFPHFPLDGSLAAPRGSALGQRRQTMPIEPRTEERASGHDCPPPPPALPIFSNAAAPQIHRPKARRPSQPDDVDQCLAPCFGPPTLASSRNQGQLDPPNHLLPLSNNVSVGESSCFGLGFRASGRRPLPSLEIDLEGAGGFQSPSEGATPSQGQERTKAGIPQLRIRPVQTKKDLPMPSPLARRGSAERAYLQGQMRAEAQRRRRQERHNEERKLRENSDIDSGDDADGEILNMMEQFNFASGDPSNEHWKPKKFAPKKKNNRPDLMEMASSPPAILMKTFKRSVSAVLADSGIEEDSNLLFFPDGVPLLRDEDELGADGAAADTQSQGSLTDHEDDIDGSPSASPRSQDSSTSDEISPSMVAADVIWQFGAFSFDDIPSDLKMPSVKSNKRVTLRPKMNASKNNITTPKNPSREFKPIRSRLKSSDSNSSSDSRSKEVRFETPDKFCPIKHDVDLGASESFQQLSFDDFERTRSRERLDSDRSIHTHESSCEKKQHQFVFSSPEAQAVRKSPAPLSEFNFQTPDNSEHRRSSRNRLCSRMPKLPELSMPEALDIPFRGRASEALDATVQEEKDAFARLADESGDILKEPLSESNYCTPDNSYSDRRSRRLSVDRMPRLPELGQPSGPALGPSRQQMHLEDNAIPAEPLRTISMNTQRANAEEFLSVPPQALSLGGPLLKEPLSASNFYTPDHSYSDSRSFRKRIAELTEDIDVPFGGPFLRNEQAQSLQTPSTGQSSGLDSSCREDEASMSLPPIPTMSNGSLGSLLRHHDAMTSCSPMA